MLTFSANLPPDPHLPLLAPRANEQAVPPLIQPLNEPLPVIQVPADVLAAAEATAKAALQDDDM